MLVLEPLKKLLNLFKSWLFRESAKVDLKKLRQIDRFDPHRATIDGIGFIYSDGMLS